MKRLSVRIKPGQKFSVRPGARFPTGPVFRQVSGSVFVFMRFLRGRDDATEQAVGLAIQAGSEVERVGHTGFAAISERQPPQTINRNGLMICVFEETLDRKSTRL